MDIKKRTVPCNHVGEPMNVFGERNLIFFKVRFNNFRDVSGSVANEVTDREVWDECECCLCLPDSYTDDGEPTQLIISCHGAGSIVEEERNIVGGVSYVMRCVDEGYAALDVNGSVPNGLSMGCPEHIFALYKAYKHAVKNYNLTERVLVAGASMGGHTAMNFVHTFPSLVIAAGLIYPRLNIDGVDVDGHHCIGTWEKNTPGADGKSTHDRIIDVYRFPTQEWCEENTIGFNPYHTRSFIGADGKKVTFVPCPIKVWQGLEDKTVDPVGTEEYVNSVRRSGSYIELKKIEGIAHKIVPVMREEILLWFNRFI